ncbi:helix-turn-helix domain-containing protein [Paenibacillus polymyxa]|uniref:Transcriptional regulator n=1 Tax=Paenibacillus polymyxa TaxID=1406 RepID=A0A378XWM5_PAEPO|nr:helix-turn-helix transcriptional regulator [Paenibacillus polymyxa]AHM65112.1 hypothetical protein PPSQR21_014600 [Paenibacillus polymyxa SQR-21]MBE7897288.1 helix-turn-helix domain-containing protein [Paenibacillus polymyxa]MCC3257463.1 helix-turn-helix domain-containing protein [Paenibacillus polymyxa]QPK51433.1 helix-turn-helix domain-containing protein [Paenibacillus polymyxa]QPK56523.1 helix-turn-helix domain-containing protein [Paenibacillus polymyxa]
MNEQEKKTMGQRIRTERELKGWSQEKLGEILGMNRTNISNYESGRTIPPGNVVKDMANLFGINSDYILVNSDVRRFIDLEVEMKGQSGLYANPDVETIAAHHDGEDWTEEELQDIEEFKELVKLRRQLRKNKE